jgi:hypothetical protein
MEKHRRIDGHPRALAPDEFPQHLRIHSISSPSWFGKLRSVNVLDVRTPNQLWLSR